MKINDNKLNVYKKLARKCESYDTFAWIIGLKEDWMSDMDISQAESELKDIYYSVHVNEEEYMSKYGKIVNEINASEEYVSDNEKIAAGINSLTKDWSAERWDKAANEGAVLDTYDEQRDFLRAMFPDADKERLRKLSYIFNETEKAFLEENTAELIENNMKAV